MGQVEMDLRLFAFHAGPAEFLSDIQNGQQHPCDCQPHEYVRPGDQAKVSGDGSTAAPGTAIRDSGIGHGFGHSRDKVTR
jgi:hypothetical protein